MKPNGWKWRVWLTLTLIVLTIALGSLYNVGSPALNGALAAKQVNGGDATYVATAAALHAPSYGWALLVVFLLVIWIPYFGRAIRYICRAPQNPFKPVIVGCDCDDACQHKPSPSWRGRATG